LKIASIVTSFPRNEKDVLIPWIIKLIQLLKEKDVETEVFTSSYCGRKDETREKIKVRRFRYFFKRWEDLSHDVSVPEKLKSNPLYFLILPFFMFFGLIAAFRFGKKTDLDIIHVHFPFPLALFGIAMKIGSKKPMIVSCHGSEVNMARKYMIFRVLFRFMMKYAEIITVNSNYMKNRVQDILKDREVVVIPMGSGIQNEERAFNDIVNKKKKILFVGRLIELKGVSYLIEAFHKLDPNKYELNLVGDGPERERLNDLAQQEEVFPNHKVKFHGSLKGAALEEMYKNADVFILPSIVDKQGYTEGLGTVLLEAISYDVPVIGTNVGGIPDIVVNGETGILVPEKDSQMITEAIERIFEDTGFTDKMIKNAKKYTAERFSWNLITEKFYNLYKKLYM